MKRYLRRGVKAFQKSLNHYQGYQIALMAAGMSYYSLFALVPIVVLVVYVTSLGGWLSWFINGDEYVVLLPNIVVDLIHSIATQSTELSIKNRFLTTSFSILILLYSASGLFYYMRRSIQVMWEVRPHKNYDLRLFLLDRLYALLILAITVIFFTGGLLSWVLGLVYTLVPDGWGSEMLHFWVLNDRTLLFVLFVGLLAMMFRYITSRRFGWGSIWIGAIVTALSLMIGQIVIGVYIQLTSLDNFFGAASSVIVVLIWIYFSMQILLFGALLTRFLAEG